MGDTEEVAEHLHRQDEREVVDHLHPPVRLDPVDHVVDDALHLRAQRFDLAGREAPLQDQPPDAGVVGRVGMDEPLREVELGEDRELRAILGRKVVHRPGQAALVGVVRDVQVGLHDVVVPGHDPAAERLAPVDGVVLAQPPQSRIRIGHERRGDEELVELSFVNRRTRQGGSPSLGRERRSRGDSGPIAGLGTADTACCAQATSLRTPRPAAASARAT